MWIWQHENWPNYSYDEERFSERARDFFSKSERLSGRIEALPSTYRADAIVDLMLSEAITTSAIEGEYLDRASVRSSLMSLIGVETSFQSDDLKAEGAATLMVDVRRHWNQPLSHELLGQWQSCVIADQVTSSIMRGAYRNSPDMMQIISQRGYKIDVHYEAPPAERVPEEMARFIEWYNDTSPITGDGSLPGPIRAGLAHVWFENIHPFDDGNGRVGRAIADHALSQSLGYPTLACLATAIESTKKTYYAELEDIGRGKADLNSWMEYFIDAVSRAQDIAKGEVDFVLGKTRFYDKFAGQLNERQAKVVARVFEEGRKGFEGGISTRKYVAIAKCPSRTASRDLANLLEKGAIEQLPGSGRSTRYELAVVETAAIPGWDQVT
ncbi:MAG: Fic family protein [Sedimenticola sp.]